MKQPVNLKFAKRLKSEGYSHPCEYFWQDIDLPHSPSGLKRTKNGEKLNHNAYDSFIYSAPTAHDGVDWLLGKLMQFESSIRIHIQLKPKTDICNIQLNS